MTAGSRYAHLFPPALRDGRPAAHESWPWRDRTVRVARLPAPDAPVTCVLLHGAGGHSELLLPYGRLLDTEVVAPDLPGYGRTGGDTDYPTWLDCATDLVAAERARSGRPVVLFGASMGGMLAYSVAARGGVCGVVTTCLLDPRRADVRRAVARFPWLGTAAPTLLSVARPLTDPVRVPIRWLARMGAMSRDPQLSAAIAADPLGGGGRVPLRFLRTYLTAVPEVEPERFTACPVLLAHPGADDWTPLALSTPFLERIAAPTRLVVLEGCGHAPVEEPGLTQLRDAVAEFLDELL